MPSSGAATRPGHGRAYVVVNGGLGPVQSDNHRLQTGASPSPSECVPMNGIVSSVPTLRPQPEPATLPVGAQLGTGPPRRDTPGWRKLKESPARLGQFGLLLSVYLLT